MGDWGEERLGAPFLMSRRCPQPTSAGRQPCEIEGLTDISLKHPHDRLRVISQEQSYRPENRQRLPVIAAVSSCKLSTSRCRDGEPSVYINSGHGSYGVTLGMGSGKIMSQIALGEKPNKDVTKFGITCDDPPSSFFFFLFFFSASLLS